MERTMKDQVGIIGYIADNIYGAGAALLSVLGIGKLFHYWATKRIDKNQIVLDLTDANAGKHIDLDQFAFKMVTDRLSVLEEKVDSLQKAHDREYKERVKFETENVNLVQKVTEFQEREKGLILQIDSQARKIDELEKSVVSTTELLHQAIKNNEEIKERMQIVKDSLADMRTESREAKAELNAYKALLEKEPQNDD